MIGVAAGLLYLGFFALASGMKRHAPALLGPWTSTPLAPRAPLAGWIAIALSLLAVLLDPDWSRALVAWFGLLPLAAGIVVLALTYRPEMARAGLALAVVLIAGDLIL